MYVDHHRYLSFLAGVTIDTFLFLQLRAAPKEEHKVGAGVRGNGCAVYYNDGVLQ